MESSVQPNLAALPPLRVRYICDGEGYKKFPAKDPQGHCDVEVIERDDRLLLSFGEPWVYRLDGEHGLLRKVDLTKPLCIDGGAGFVIPADEMIRVWDWVAAWMVRGTAAELA